MKALLRFECIGDGAPHSRVHQMFGIRGPARYYVYALFLNQNGLLERRFLPHKKDYTLSNGVGTRGVYAEYILDEGGCYEVKQPVSWKRGDHYFCAVRDGELVRLSRDEVQRCLVSAPSG